MNDQSGTVKWDRPRLLRLALILVAVAAYAFVPYEWFVARSAAMVLLFLSIGAFFGYDPNRQDQHNGRDWLGVLLAMGGIALYASVYFEPEHPLLLRGLLTLALLLALWPELLIHPVKALRQGFRAS